MSSHYYNTIHILYHLLLPQNRIPIRVPHIWKHCQQHLNHFVKNQHFEGQIKTHGEVDLYLLSLDPLTWDKPIPYLFQSDRKYSQLWDYVNITFPGLDKMQLEHNTPQLFIRMSSNFEKNYKRYGSSMMIGFREDFHDKWGKSFIHKELYALREKLNAIWLLKKRRPWGYKTGEYSFVDCLEDDMIYGDICYSKGPLKPREEGWESLKNSG